jgi:WD40 repeat protein
MKRWIVLTVIAASIIYITPTVMAEVIRPLSCSPDGKKILFARGCKNDRGYIYNMEDNRWTEIEAVVGCLAESWKNNNSLGVKIVDRETGLQCPAMVNIERGKIIPIDDYLPSAGFPVFSGRKTIFPRGNRLALLRTSGRLNFIQNALIRGHFAPTSPDGRYIASSGGGRLQVWDIKGILQFKSDGPGAFGIPFWSPDGRRLAVKRGNIKIYDLSGNKVEYGPIRVSDNGPFYSNPRWLPDGSGLIFISWMIEGDEIFSELIEINCQGKLIQRFPLEMDIVSDPLPISEDRVVLTGLDVVGLYRFDEGGLFILEELSQDYIDEIISSPPPPDSLTASVGKVMTEGVPFVHQLYGTPFWCKGYNMCGPASCVMAIGYYRVLPYWPTEGKSYEGYDDIKDIAFVVGGVNSWGNYIPGLFENNGEVFDTVTNDSSTSNGYTPSRGIHGEVHTDGGASWFSMQTLLNDMGLDAELHTVPWDQNIPFDEYCKYIDESGICLINCKLPGGGHVICGIGYNENGSVIVNDPYGEKKSKDPTNTYPNFKGEGAVYDYDDNTENGNDHLGGTTCAMRVGRGRSEAQDQLLVIDDSTVGTTRCGFEKDESSSWQSSDLYGYASTGKEHPYGNGLYYLNSVSNENDAGWARWWFDLRKRGRHTFYVFIPDGPYGRTEEATYSLLHRGRTLKSWQVNQKVNGNKWVKLGSKWLRRGSYSIELTNATGSDDGIVVFDAIMVEGRGIDPR